jgi:small subunit ribosomal protein S2
MSTVELKTLLESGVQFGHMSSYWNPSMAPYIYCVRQKMHIIDLRKTKPMLEQAIDFVEQLAEKGGSVLFVGTKRAAQDIMEEQAKRSSMPFVIQRWLGGTLTNYKTIRKSVERRHLAQERLEAPEAKNMLKKERLSLMRTLAKLDSTLSGILDMKSLPDALFVVDVGQEITAIKEANKLGIPVIGIVDTNHTLTGIDYPVPGNDDATKSIQLYAELIANAVLSGRERSKTKSTAAPVVADRRDKKTAASGVKITRQGVAAPSQNRPAPQAAKPQVKSSTKVQHKAGDDKRGT